MAELPRDPHEGLTLGNDILGVRLWGNPQSPTFMLGASDIWDRRWFADRQPLITMEKVTELAMADRLQEVAKSPNETAYHLYQRYDFPCPKPGVQVTFLTPFADSARVSTKANSVRLELTGQGKSLAVLFWVTLAERIVVCECRQRGLTSSDFAVRVYRHRDTIVPGGATDPTIGGHPSATDFEQLPAPTAFSSVPYNVWGIKQAFAPDSTFPDGFEFAVVATPEGLPQASVTRSSGTGLGTPYWAEKEGRLDHGTVKRYKPINDAEGAVATATFGNIPATFSILATLATSQDSPNPVQKATADVDEARNRGTERLRDKQARALRNSRRPLRAAAMVSGTEEFYTPAVIPPSLRHKGGFYGDVPMCSVGPTKYCFQDSGLWHADFHLNEIRAEPLLTMGRFEDVYLFAEMIRTLLAQAEENAADVYGLPGAMYPLVHFPLRCRGIAHSNLTWEQDIGLNGLIAKPLWLYYRYTLDLAFLREIAYPVMRSCAVFCHAYLSEGVDGFLHIAPTVSPEHWGLTARFERNRDCTSALTLTKYLLNAASEAAEILGVDHSEAGRWRIASNRLTPYPTFTSDAGVIWTDVLGAPPIEYNIPVPLSPVFWGDDVGLDSPPEVRALADRTLERINVWPPHRFYLDTCVRPRLGVFREGAPVVPESFLLSYQTIHVFAGAPPRVPIEIRNLVAQGGFRVSAERNADGEVGLIRVFSPFGGRCVITDPRTGEQTTRETERGETFCL